MCIAIFLPDYCMHRAKKFHKEMIVKKVRMWTQFSTYTAVLERIFSNLYLYIKEGCFCQNLIR